VKRKSLYILAFVCSFVATRASAEETVTIAWDRSATADTAGYVLLAGPRSGEYTATQDVGNVTEWQTALEPGTYYFAVKTYTSKGQMSVPSAEASVTIGGGFLAEDPASTSPSVPTWELLWQNDRTGQLAGWGMTDNRMVMNSPLGSGAVSDIDWQLRASADMDGDGQKDLVFQHKQGYLAVWTMSGDQMTDARLLNPGRLTDLDWRLMTAGDLDGDGHADLVFEHTRTGALAAWLMDRTSLREGVPFGPGRVTDLDWRIVATADLNADGKSDLVWQHKSQGLLSIWLMNGSQLLAGSSFSVPGPSDPAWAVRAAADVNADGKIDLVFQHEKLNYVAIWLLDGYSFLSASIARPGVVSTGWRIAGAR
jgi:hypothetical protein